MYCALVYPHVFTNILIGNFTARSVYVSKEPFYQISKFEPIKKPLAGTQNQP